jgi:hypothetical protein
MILIVGFPASCPALVSDANQDRRGSGLRRLQGRRELETVRRHNAVIVIGSDNQRRRIFRSLRDVVQR